MNGNWPLIAIHAAITPDGRVLTYGTKADGTQTGNFIYDVWDWTAGLTGGHVTLNNVTATDIFCSSQIILPQSGDILISGGDNWTGTSTTNTGNNDSNLFSYGDNALTSSTSMNRARWYSSSTALVNGEIYIQGGSSGGDRPEVREITGGFRLLTGAVTSPYAVFFPRNFLAPDGRVFGYDFNAKMYFVDTSGTGSLVSAGTFSTSYSGWESGAAMFRPGEILQMGGNSNGAIVINIKGPTPTITPTAGMSSQRRWVSATVLPNGQVLATGGSRIANQLTDVNNSAEIWDPNTGQWHVGSSGARARLYHSSALLLPDATVLVAGGGAPGPYTNTNAEIYYPPYLYNGVGGFAVRPQIISAPDTANVGDNLSVQVDSSIISRVTLVKTGSVTHSVNMDQRFVELPFNVSGNMLDVSLPPRATDTPPGFYLMFAINDSGVPSFAHMMRVNIDLTPNSAVDYTPAIGGAGGNSFQLACNADEILVGIHGKYATYINQIGPKCVKMDQFGHWIDAPIDRPVTGSTSTGTSFAKVCPVDFAMSGFQGRSGSFVDQLDIECKALTPTGELTGAGQFLGPVGGSGGSTQGPYACGTNNPVYALYGRSDSQIDSFGVQCRQGVITPISTGTVPVIVDPGTQAGTVGVPVILQINASDGDELPLPLTFDAAPPAPGLLPPGLVIDTNTGLITGTPTIDGTYNAEVTTTDGATIVTANFDWIIDPTPPLSVDPMPPTTPLEVNTVVNYTATANGGVNVMYKWDFGDGTPETGYSSSPSVAHTFTSPGVNYVILTVIDDAGIPAPQTFVQGVHLPLTTNSPSTSTNLLYEDRSAGNARLWVVNQDNDSVSVFNAVTKVKEGEIPVGVSPRNVAIAPDNRVWVTNKSSASISIINPGTLSVEQTVTYPDIPFASQPYGIVFSPVVNEAYVALQASGLLLKLDASTGSQLGSFDTGPNPRGVAINGPGNRVYVSRFITARQIGEETLTVAPPITDGGEILVVDSGSMTLFDTIVLQSSVEPDFENQGRGVPNYLGALAISPDGTSGRVPSKKDNIFRGSGRDSFNLNFQNTVRSISSSIDLLSNTEDYSKRIDYDNASLSSAIVFDKEGIIGFVAQETSREVAVIDAYADFELFRIDVGRAPQGLAISPDGLRLYVSNFMDRTVDVFDLTILRTLGQFSASNIGTLPSVANEKLSPQVFLGKQLFYDAFDTRLAFDRYLSCAVCHNDSAGDGRVWDLTGFGEGLRNTINLTGRGKNHGRRHWTANFDEVQDFEGQIRALSQGTGLMDQADFDFEDRSEPLGLPKAGISPDLDALAAYVDSLNEFASSPNRNGDGSPTADAMAGRQVFKAENCGSCHSGWEFTDSNSDILHDIGTMKVSSGSRLGDIVPLVDPITGLANPGMGLDTPTLRGVWDTAPYLHDGSAETLAEAVLAHNGVTLVDPQLSQLVAFLEQIDNLSIGVCLDCIDFSTETTIPYHNQDVNGTITVLNGGESVQLAGNTWHQSLGTYTITANTIVEFVFQSTSEGEVHGLGFDENNSTNPARIFRVYGTQIWGIADYADYTGPEPKFYQIPVGQYYTGTNMHLVLANDDDANSSGNGTFSNIRVYEPPAPPTPPVANNPGNQYSQINDSVSLTISASDANGDTLSFTATGLPVGLTIDSSNGAITGTVLTPGTSNNVTITVDDGNGGSDTAIFDWTVYDPVGGCPDCLDFNVVTTSSFSNQDLAGNVSVADAGATLVLTDNTWRETDQTFNIMADTIIEFDFQSTGQGEVQGLGFEEDSSTSPDRIFRLYGTQVWGIANYANYAGGLQHYQIPVGQYYVGSAMKLVFSNDNDGGFGNDSRFTNVRIFNNVNLPPTITSPGNQATALNAGVSLIINAIDPSVGDVLSFSGVGLPVGLSINSSSGEISGTATTLGTYNNVTITVNDGNGGSDIAIFDWIVYDPTAGCVDCLDFNVVTTSSYSNQDIASNVSVADAGATLVLTDNTWRSTDQTFNIAISTILEFDFQSSVEGEVHGIGFDDDNSDDGTRSFKLYGTQNWGIADYDTYIGGGQSHYQIPVGQYYTGVSMKLVFANDYDAGSGNESRFSNVRVFDGSVSDVPPTITNPGDQMTELNSGVSLTITATDPNAGDVLIFSDAGLPVGLSINSSTGEISGTATLAGTYNVTITVDDGNGGFDSAAFEWLVCDPVVDCGYLDFNSVTTSPYSNQEAPGNVSVADAGLTLVLTDNIWHATDQTFNITANTVIEFDFQSTVEGEVQGIGFDENSIWTDDARVFQLYGTQTWGIPDFRSYAGGGVTHYKIPIGQYYVGSTMKLVFANDNDAGVGNDSRFSRVRIYE